MAKYSGPKIKVIRRLGDLPGFTTKLSRKTATVKTKRKVSQYNTRLLEKQKLRFNYGISEKQLRRYFQKARKKKGPTGELLLQFLELRLDSIVFRLGISPTIASARQLICHGHIEVNDKLLTIPNYQCSLGDSITLQTKSLALKTNCQSVKLPSHLSKVGELFQITKLPYRQEISLQIEELLVVEYYSR